MDGAALFAHAPATVKKGRARTSLSDASLPMIRVLPLVALPIVLIASSSGARQTSESWPPAQLRDTGLYADWERREIDPRNLPFSPQYPLWSDGAAKRRWVRLPEGTFIDASNPDAWEFPVGTRLWKEFRFDRVAETRFIERTADGWRYAAYAWTEDGQEAPLAPARGVPRSVPIRDGVRHAIPSRTDCTACHEAGTGPVLGLSSLQLSPDRDPNAPHAEPLPPGAVTLPNLVQRGLLRGLPSRLLEQPPRVRAATPTARAALGYLHANCGTCHSSAGELASLSFSLTYPVVGTPDAPVPAIATSLGLASKFEMSGNPDLRERVCAGGDPDHSMLVQRMSSRHPALQMPPLGTRLVDEHAVGLVRRWIAEDLRATASLVRTQE